MIIRNFAHRLPIVTQLRIAEAAELLGVSDDTVRRWADQGRVKATRDGGRTTIDGKDLAEFARDIAVAPQPGPIKSESARNRLKGIVTRVVRDTVMAQVEIQAGPFRMVSLMSREAADEMKLEVGEIAVASVKATHVVVEIPDN